MQELAERTWARPEFHADAASIQRAWIARDSGSGPVELPPLEAAARAVQASAILACSENATHRLKAYRCATSAFDLYGHEALPLDQATRVVLARLGNFPAFGTRRPIAQARELMPLRLAAEELVLTEPRTVVIGEQAFVLTDFQHRFWQKLNARTRLAVSAPTSAGKSFVLGNFLASRLTEGEEHSLVYIVPTRALIAQVSDDLVRRIGRPPADRVMPEVVTVPIQAGRPLPRIAGYVMTQERVQMMLVNHPGFRAEIVVVDEAHSISEGSRGILLHWVVEELLARNRSSQLLFASPGVRNLDVFGRAFELADVEPLPSFEPTVAQNFLQIRITDHDRGSVELYLAEKGLDLTLIASRELNQRMWTLAEMLVNSACAFGIGATNIVYANGAAQAEDIAIRIAMRFRDRETTKEQEALAQLAAEAVHPTYALVQCVRKGVGFHYSDIPTHVRQAIEKAVTNGVLDYLVCTSTLLQGVNLPAKNLFMCRPEKGKRIPLESVDFWNLAGRAGRLLKEFQGNIFLIQYESWRKKPLGQRRQVEIVPAIEAGIAHRPQALLRAIQQPTVRDDDLEAMFVRLLDDYAAGRLEHRLLQMQGGGLVTEEMARTVLGAVASASGRITLPRALIRRSPNISAHKQQRLYDALTRYFGSMPERAAGKLVPRHPGQDGDYASYKAILKICYRIILRHKPGSGFHRFAALLALWWMQGRPLPQIVENQLKRNPTDDEREKRRLVRETLKLVEREVRFECVRLFGCYSIILRQVLGDIGRHDLLADIPDLPLFLEVGASDRTTISLMSIGLSRVVASKVAIHAPSSDLDVEMERKWLRFRSVDSLGLSAGLQAEVRDLLVLLDEQTD